MKKTLIVNLYAGPGAGKSTAASYLFAKLKMIGVNAEYVTEYAKDATWEGAMEKLRCQIYITGKQAYRIFRVCGKVDVVITDSPLALGSIYTDDTLLQQLCIKEGKKYEPYSLNLFIQRPPSYETSGRNQTHEEAIEIDGRIRTMLSANSIPYYEIKGTEAILNAVTTEISLLLKGIKTVSEFHVDMSGQDIYHFDQNATKLSLIGK